MFSVFRDPGLQKQFEQNGYILQSSLLGAGEVETLSALFTKFRDEYNGAFHTSHFSTDVVYKKQVHDTLAGLVFPKASPLLNNFMPLFGNFMIKNSDPENFMPLHADWTYVDEQQFCSVAIWIPLVDVDAENGCLGIIEGSHKVTNIVRGPLIQQSSHQHDKDWARRFGKLIPMKAGDAIIYNHALLHYSPPNKTIVARPALNLSIVPEAAKWLHYCKPEGVNEIEVYSVPDSSFYIRYNNFQRPETGTLIKTLPGNVIELIDDRMENYGRRKGVFNRVKEWFSA
jgi:hypothetical protein